MGFPKIDKGTMIMIFFFNFQSLGIKTSMLTNIQVHPTIFTETMALCLQSLYFGQYDGILAKNDVIAPQGKSVKSKNCHVLMVYGYIHEYKHQNSIQCIVPEKKQGGDNAPPMPGGHSKGPCKVGLRWWGRLIYCATPQLESSNCPPVRKTHKRLLLEI